MCDRSERDAYLITIVALAGVAGDMIREMREGGYGGDVGTEVAVKTASEFMRSRASSSGHEDLDPDFDWRKLI